MKKYLARVIPHFKKKVHLVYSYNGEVPNEPELPAGLKWDIVTVDLIDRIMKDDDWRRITINKLMDKGVVGVIMHDGNNWAAYGFISPPGVSLPDHLPQQIVKEYFWMMFVYVKPEWRGQSLQKNNFVARLFLLNETYDHIKNIIGDTSVSNIPSRKNTLNAGYEPAGIITTIELRLPFFDPKFLWWRWDHDELHPSI